MSIRITSCLAACSLAWFALGVTAGPLSAGATTCHVEPPQQRKGEWVYRTVEGKKCWYEGPQVIPKSDLRWPRPSAALVRARDAQASLLPAMDTNDERHPDWRHAMQPTSFEARWRGLTR